MREEPAAGKQLAAGRTVELVRGVGLLGATALVVVNMVGSSIYTLPASIAKEVGPLGIVAWALTALGYLFVAFVYARLGTRYPRTGGPYVYARHAFGDGIGFVTVWSYWLSAAIGNAAIVQGAVGYAPNLWPGLAGDRTAQFVLALVLIWTFTALNVLGVRSSARFQIAILFLGLVPLVTIGFFGLLHFDAANLHPFKPHGWEALPAGVALIVWAYSGVESATVPAEEVRNPETTIKRSTYLGYAIGTVVYLALAVGIAGALANDEIASSTQPVALLAERTAGSALARVVAITAILACLGTLNGWILMAGRIPVTAAEDGLFFRGMARIHPRFHTPAVSLIVGGVIASGMMFLLLDSGLLAAFTFIVMLAGFLTLLPHLIVAAADWKLGRGRQRVTAAVAFVFIAFAIYGCGWEADAWGLLLVLAGLPLGWVLHRQRGARTAG